MAKKKDKPTVDSVVSSFLDVSDKSGGSRAYLSGDHAERTWGVPIPHLVLQHFIGGSDVLPLQRYIGVSGEKGSCKSTLMVAFGNMFIGHQEPDPETGELSPQGIHQLMDLEEKLSPEMLRAMVLGDIYPRTHEVRQQMDHLRETYGEGLSEFLTAQMSEDEVDQLMRKQEGVLDAQELLQHRMLNYVLAQVRDECAARMARRRIPEGLDSMEDWMEEATDFIGKSKAALSLPKYKRIALMLTADSLMAKATREQKSSVAKEGHAEGRQFPVGHAMLTNYLDAMNLARTPLAFSYVQHMKEKIDAQGHGKQYREKGATAAGFAASIHIRSKKIGTISIESHPGRWIDGPKVMGYTLQLETSKSCVGPDKRRMEVDLIWQYAPTGYDPQDLDDRGTPRMLFQQVMGFDWDGALGAKLADLKYGKGQLSQFDKERLAEFLHFVVDGKNFKCEQLGIEKGTCTEFGRAIRQDPQLVRRLQNFLGITRYRSFQSADVETEDG